MPTSSDEGVLVCQCLFQQANDHCVRESVRYKIHKKCLYFLGVEGDLHKCREGQRHFVCAESQRSFKKYIRSLNLEDNCRYVLRVVFMVNPLGAPFLGKPYMISIVIKEGS